MRRRSAEKRLVVRRRGRSNHHARRDSCRVVHRRGLRSYRNSHRLWQLAQKPAVAHADGDVDDRWTVYRMVLHGGELHEDLRRDH